MSTEADAGVNALAFPAGRRRRAVAVIDTFTSWLAPDLVGVTHVRFRTLTCERSWCVLANGCRMASIGLSTFININTLVVLRLESRLAIANWEVIFSSAGALAA